MYKVLCVLLSCIFLFGGVHENELLADREVTHTVHCTWETVYSDIESMANDADLIVSGYVREQEYRKSETEVYSVNLLDVYNVLKGESESQVEIRQIGGTVDGYETPFPDEIVAIEKNEEYVLFLKKAIGQEYYYIAGANQGLFQSEDINHSADLDQIVELYSELFERNELARETGQARIVITPNYGVKWVKETVYFYMPQSSNVTSTQLSNLKSGAKAWNTINSECKMAETSSSAADVIVGYSGAQLGIAGLTNLSHASNIIESAKVTFYYNNLGDSSATKWRTCAVHEFGHVYGLDHYPGGDTSVMYADLNDCSTSPQTADILSMEDLYGL